VSQPRRPWLGTCKHLLVLVILNKLLKFFNVSHTAQIVLYVGQVNQMGVIRLLIIWDHSQNIVHFVPPLLWFKATRMGMGHVNVCEIRQE
jgi:hypothetical protein